MAVLFKQFKNINFIKIKYNNFKYPVYLVKLIFNTKMYFKLRDILVFSLYLVYTDVHHMI